MADKSGASKDLNTIAAMRMPADPEAHEVASGIIGLATTLAKAVAAVVYADNPRQGEMGYVADMLRQAEKPDERLINKTGTLMNLLTYFGQFTNYSGSGELEARHHFGWERFSERDAQAMSKRLEPFKPVIAQQLAALRDVVARVDSPDPLRQWNLDLYPAEEAASMRRGIARNRLAQTISPDGGGDLRITLNGKTVDHAFKLI